METCVSEFGILAAKPCEKFLLEDDEKPYFISGSDGSFHHPKLGVYRNDEYFVEYIQYEMDPSDIPKVNIFRS